MFGMFCIRKKSLSIAGREEGVAFIEFALSVGILIIMFFGAVEITRYILIVQKVEKTIDTLTDVLSQEPSGAIQSSDITQYLNAAQQLMNPYTFGANGRIILTDVWFDPTNNPTLPTVKWQVCGGGTYNATSIVAPGGTASIVQQANLPTGFTLDPVEQEEVVIGEVFYNFQPILIQSIVASSQLYRVAVFKPRYGPLSTTSSGC